MITVPCLRHSRFHFKNKIARITQRQPRLLLSFIDPLTLLNSLCFQPRFHSQTDSNREPVLQSLLCATTSCSTLSYLRTTHARVVKFLNYRDGFIGDLLVSKYTRLGCFQDAHQLFDEMSNKDLVSWNSFISICSRIGEVGKSLSAFSRMRSELEMKPNEVTLISVITACANSGAVNEGFLFHGLVLKTGIVSECKVSNSLINMYGKLGCLDSACKLFESMLVPNLVSWNSVVKVCGQNGFGGECIALFRSMRRDGIDPDRATMVSLLQGLGDRGVGKLADMLHGYILSAGLSEDTAIATALLTVYAKSGRLNASREVFKQMKDPDRIAWTAMLAAFAVHGKGRNAVELFDLMVMKCQEPDHVTFTHLLCACSHSGLVEEGKRYFEMMRNIHRIEPRLDHYSCMVDLLGRSGNLKDAYGLIRRMPMEPNSAVWGALLNACKVHRNIELGKEVAELLFQLNPSDPRNYLLLSNMFSAAGQWTEASKVRASMKERSLMRDPGCSFIEHGLKVHRFAVGDRLHPETERIYIKLEELLKKIQKVGYVYKTEFVLHDVDDEAKENMINKHSEKLAIAFGLLVTAANVPLIITKNLRICGDCHSMAKFVSLTEKHTIIIRDTKRFHHFADGLCSCGDFCWYQEDTAGVSIYIGSTTYYIGLKLYGKCSMDPRRISS